MADSIWTTIALVFGGGAIGSVITGLTQYMLAKAKQPVDQYDILAKTLMVRLDQERAHFEQLINQERIHCDERLRRLEAQISAYDTKEDAYMIREFENREKLGELRGQLAEQRRLIDAIVHQTETHSVMSAMAKDKTATKQ